MRKKLAEFIINAERLSMGDQCKKFEKNFAEKQECKYCVFVNSGSSANLALIQALLNDNRLKKGDKIGISAITWATNVMPLIQLGLEPVAIDCEISSLNISPRKLEQKIDNIKALFLTNTLGFCDRIDKIEKICKEKNVIFLEDNCESLGSKCNGKLLGNFGLASTFSFFVGHHLSTVEGGMICTNNKRLYHKLLKVRAHGWDRDLPEYKKTELQNKYNIDDFFKRYTFYDLAFNIRPTEIQGFLGNEQLEYWDDIVDKREKNFFIFFEKIKKNNDIETPNLDHMDIVSNFAIPLIFKNKKKLKKYRNKFITSNVEIRPIVAGDITKQPFYKKHIHTESDNINADTIHEHGFYFGNNPELTEKEINILTKLLKN